MSTATSTKVNCDVKRFDGEWKVSVIRKLVSTPVTDGPHSTPQFLDNGIPFLSVNNIVDNKISNKNLRHISKLDHIRFSKKCKPQRNDILLGKAATVGTVAIVDTDLEFNIWSPLALIRFGELVIPRFAYYFLQCEDIRRQIDFLTNSSSQGNIGMGDINRLSIILPPLSEQRAIAKALSDVDELIDSLDALIVKKRDMKQGAMQQLLTGKTRLPGFDGEWKVSVIRKLVSTPVTDGPHSTPQFLDNGIPFLSVNNIVDNKISNKNLRHISKLDHIRFSKKCKPQRNDILLGKAATVGTVAIVDTDLEFNIWSPLALIRFGELVIPRFAYYFLQCEDIRRQIDFLTNSSSQGNIGMGDINRLSIILPPLSEQRAIASILSDMDAEIEALEKRKAKTIYIKQGMMQELLTGKTRLPERESA